MGYLLRGIGCQCDEFPGTFIRRMSWHLCGCNRTPRRPATSSAAAAAAAFSAAELRACYNCDSSAIRARYEVFRALAYEIDSSTPRESVVGVSCMLIDSSMHTIFTLYLYIGLPYIVCVNTPEIVYTNAIKCQYAEYTIIHCEIIVMLK